MFKARNLVFKVTSEPGIGQNVEATAVPMIADSSRASAANTSRRAFMIRSLMTSALVSLGLLRPKSAAAQGTENGSEADTDNIDQNDEELEPTVSPEEAAEKLMKEPIGLVILDAIGTVAFVDAIVGISRGKDSFVNAVFRVIKNQFVAEKTSQLQNGHHSAHFPIGNLALAGALNAVRATQFGPEVAYHTKHEFQVTVTGVGLLAGFTSAAKGMARAEEENVRMFKASKEQIATDPETVLSDSIWQLTALASVTQWPLTAFGNASIGNSEFGDVSAAYDNIYTSVLDGAPEAGNRTEITAHIRRNLDSIENKKVQANIEKVLKNGSFLNSVADFEEALKAAANEHTKDLMNILMSTACDDAQAAAGDAGPLVGIYQTFGLKAVGQVAVSLIPYTLLIGIERAYLAAERAGIPASSILTAEHMKYMGKFFLNTWKNFFAYLVMSPYNYSKKLAGDDEYMRVHGMDIGDGKGVDFALFGQVFKDAHNIIGGTLAAAIGSVTEGPLDMAKVKSAIADYQAATAKVKTEVGDRIDKAESVDGERKISDDERDEIAREIMGSSPTDADLQGLLDHVKQVIDDDPRQQDIKDFVQHLRQIQETQHDHLQHALHEWMESEGAGHGHGATPNMAVLAKILKENPNLADLLNFDYWHDRIGPELTDTIFVVFLQGLHLPFIINTVNRAVYNADWFQAMPLKAQEVSSVLLNDVMSMFADNWADAVSHAKWLTGMYFNKLGKDHFEPLLEKYPELAEAATSTFSDDPNTLVPERFEARKQQFVGLLAKLKATHPEDAAKLDEVGVAFFEDAETYYWRALNMSMLTAVTGGGKALTGNAPHFTFAGGIDDFDLQFTLDDFKRHPLYHVWELFFSTTYSIVVGPAISQTLFGQSGAKQFQTMMQTAFNNRFPGVNEKFAELKKQDDANQTPQTAQTRTRRDLLRGKGVMDWLRGEAA